MATDSGSTPDLAKRVSQLEETFAKAKMGVWIVGGILGVSTIASLLQINSKINQAIHDSTVGKLKDQVETVEAKTLAIDEQISKKIKPQIEVVGDRVKAVSDNLDNFVKKGPLIQKGGEPIDLDIPAGRKKTFTREFPFEVKNAWIHCLEHTKSHATIGGLSTGIPKGSEEFIIEIKTEGKVVTGIVTNPASSFSLKLKLELFASAY